MAGARSTEKQAESGTTRGVAPSTVSDVYRPLAPEVLSEDDEMERCLVEAELAGRRTVADALARQLEARRRARARNVVSLDAKRSSSR
jgi:hypothetical protein